MARCVGIGEIQGDYVRALLRWQMEPGRDLIDSLFVGEFPIEPEIVAGTNSPDVRLATDPGETSGSHTLLLGQDPERSSAIPGAVAD